jgi:hypothetical protein
MKNKLALIALSLSLLSSLPAQAQESEEGKGEKFSAHKAEIISSLNQEKSIIDAEIACITSASKRDDAKACHEAKRSSMKALRQEREAAMDQRRSERKSKLEEGIKKIDDRKENRESKREH